LDAGRRPFEATFVRRHHIGSDLVTTFGPFALRIDAAYDSNRVFYRRDLVSQVSDAVQAVASLEYQTGELGKSVLVETVWLHIFDDVAPHSLLGYERDSSGVALQARWTFRERLEAQLRGFVGLRPATYVVEPRLTWKWTSFALRAGLLLLDGDPFSFGGYFRRNTCAYGMVRVPL
jgi:hypothetical protein